MLNVEVLSVYVASMMPTWEHCCCEKRPEGRSYRFSRRSLRR